MQDGRWHQDGAFLGEHIRAFNCWLALTPCGTDAPGLDIVPKRFDHIVPNDGARYDWAISDQAVAAASAGHRHRSSDGHDTGALRHRVLVLPAVRLPLRAAAHPVLT